MTIFNIGQLTFISRDLSDHELLNQSTSNEWYTPAVYIEAAREVMGSIDLDPASCAFANQMVKAARYYTIHDDGLLQDWHGNVWLNPPYGRLNGKSNQALWSQKLIAEHRTGRVRQALMLTNVATGTRWFSPLWDFPICFVVGRIQFYTDGYKLGQGATHDNAIVYLGENDARFVEFFSQFGPIVRRVDNGHSQNLAECKLF